MKNTKRYIGRILRVFVLFVAFSTTVAYRSEPSIAQSTQESNTPAASSPVSTHGDEDYSAVYNPGDIRKDNPDIAKRTRYDPICNAMITTSGDYEYGYYDVVGGILITKYTGSSSVVHIPESIDGMPVRGIGVGVGADMQEEYYGAEKIYGDLYDYPFGILNKPDSSYRPQNYSPFANSDIVEVYIPDGVISIGGSAFSNCSKLEHITLPDSTRYIDGGAFARSGLTSISIPSRVTTIGAYAFSGCTELRSVTLSEGIEYILYGAFKDCTKLSSIVIPNGVEEIFSETFNGCTGLTSITIPDSVIRISDDRDGRGIWGSFEGIPNFSATYRGGTYTSSSDLYAAIKGQNPE